MLSTIAAGASFASDQVDAAQDVHVSGKAAVVDGVMTGRDFSFNRNVALTPIPGDQSFQYYHTMASNKVDAPILPIPNDIMKYIIVRSSQSDQIIPPNNQIEKYGSGDNIKYHFNGKTYKGSRSDTGIILVDGQATIVAGRLNNSGTIAARDLEIASGKVSNTGTISFHSYTGPRINNSNPDKK